MMPTDRPKLVQVMYNERFGLLAFFDDGTTAIMFRAADGGEAWKFGLNIWESAKANAE